MGYWILIGLSVFGTLYFGGGYFMNARKGARNATFPARSAGSWLCILGQPDSRPNETLRAFCAGEPGIPHADFWHSLPDLVKDGYFFATEKTQGLSGKGGYEGL